MTYRRLMPKITVSILCMVILAMAPGTLMAQQESGSSPDLMESLEDFFKRDYLSFGLLIQNQGQFYWQPEGTEENTFRIPTARLKVYGELDNNFGYTLQADMARAPSILDAKISYTYNDRFSITTGAQKPGFSGEYLTSSANTDFINRSRIVNIIAGSRDVGVLTSLVLTEGLVVYGGVFNGRNHNLESGDSKFYYTGRIEAGSDINQYTSLAIGLNAGHGQEEGTLIGNGTLPAINGNRTVYGGDIRFEWKGLLLSGEILGGQLEFNEGTLDEVLGYHGTIGYRITDKFQFLARYDHVESNIGLFPVRDLVLGGINYQFTDAASFQLNYQVNPEVFDIDNQVLLVQAQLAF